MAKTARRSIDALFAPSQPTGVEDMDNARTIAVDLLDPNPFQPRKTFDEAALAELANDIKVHGVLQPLLVRPHPQERGRYQIAAGERRWRAARLAGLGEVPCIERDMDDDAMERLALVENVQRTNLDPLDEAHAYQRLMDRFDVSLRDLAATVHKHHEYIAQRLRLIKEPRIEALVRDDKMKPSTAQELVRVKNEEQRDAFIERAERGERVSVQEVRAAQGVRRQGDLSEVSKVSTDVHRVPEPLTAPREVSKLSTPESKAVVLNNSTPGPMDGLKAALDTLDAAAVAEVVRFGVSEQWTCEQLLVAIEAVRTGDNR
ncbi:MAG: ParB/RepB/Spo0J family partition protein [Chloroflexota bacterium]|nr:ParB/RepB/Spo0J family partition protein [Chloroflexota bacterium]